MWEKLNDNKYHYDLGNGKFAYIMRYHKSCFKEMLKDMKGTKSHRNYHSDIDNLLGSKESFFLCIGPDRSYYFLETDLYISKLNSLILLKSEDFNVCSIKEIGE